jgi:hypothetical protein
VKLFRRFFKVKITPRDELKAINDAVIIMHRLISRSSCDPANDDTLMWMRLQKRIMDRLTDRYWRIPGAI